MKVMWEDPYYRERFSSTENREISERGIQNIRNVHIGKVISEETRNKISKANRVRWEKDREKMLDLFASPEYKKAHREGVIETHRTPEFREKMSRILKGSHRTPEYREKMSKIMKEWWKKNANK